tara:strand:- start:1347 stop:3956 length:2610 start_codon:yes stop_codon:yes gene_type:complete
VIDINQVEAVLKAQINAKNLSPNSVLSEDATRILEELERQMLYPDWENRNDTLAAIEFAVAQVDDNEKFVQDMGVDLVSLAKRSQGTERCGWFVGAMYDSSDDQLPRFLAKNIWQNGYDDKYSDLVRSMVVGDKIAIKSAYTKKHHLPFDGNGHFASVMAIKAIGTITKNLNDGKTVEVNWDDAFLEPREWYFYTSRTTIWKVESNDWMSESLLDFTFRNEIQNYKRFAEEPYWKERFSPKSKQDSRFNWSHFYETFASAIVDHKDNRKPLTDFVSKLAEKHDLSYLNGKELDDICPFTVMGLFNRQITDANRIKLAEELGQYLKVDVEVPKSFEGIPILNNMKSWFFAYKQDRQEIDIDNLWELFHMSLLLADEPSELHRSRFEELYNLVSAQNGIGWNLSMGLFWIRPWNYPTLDTQSRTYFTSLGFKLGLTGAKGRCSAIEYLKVQEDLETRFSEDKFPVHSFPDFSFKAWQSPTKPQVKGEGWKALILERIKKLCIDQESELFTRKEFHSRYLEELKELFPDNNSSDMTIDRQMQILRDEHILGFVEKGKYEWFGYEDEDQGKLVKVPTFEKYTVSDIVSEGCFLSKDEIFSVIKRLKDKKNIILQGSPGTGKTWLAKKLAMALIGEKRESNITAVQFHPNLSYEDFIRGWRPSGDGKLSLCDGPFLNVVDEATKNPTQVYVVVIEEVNRGNPAQIFGEMLTLLEADKRTPTERLSLSYMRDNEVPVYVPENLFLIGTMNIADRSLALVDLALRRRFAFINLRPEIGETWRRWVNTQHGLDDTFLQRIQTRMVDLNKKISDDPRLGKQFQVGHSYVTPSFHNKIDEPVEWFKDIVETEIYPLLEEYWFDSPNDAIKAKDALIEGL